MQCNVDSNYETPLIAGSDELLACGIVNPPAKEMFVLQVSHHTF